MSNSDKLHRFTFQNSDVRGEIISLDNCYQAVVQGRNYPAQVQAILGQCLAATGLLSATIKFDGVLTLQARGDGPLRLLMTDCTRQHYLRGIARIASDNDLSTVITSGEGNPSEIDSSSPHFRSLLGKGYLAITIDPAGGERYQGLVSLDKEDIASCLESYFELSEQLPTRLWLAANDLRATGLLLQALPLQTQTLEERDQYWQHIGCLADTLSEVELLTLDSLTLLSRLFQQQVVRLMEARPMSFACSCSLQRTGEVLRSLGREEVNSILEEEGLVEIRCQFCDQLYRYTSAEINQLFAGEQRIVH